MIRFFIENISDNNYTLTGEDAHHAIKSLRVKIGENIILCDKNSFEHICKVEKISKDEVLLSAIKSQKNTSESNIKITLYQALPKNDKMDLIVQKSVELGVFKIVPIETSRCISKPSEKSISKKIERWQKIAKEAAKQSGRGIIPNISSPLKLDEAISKIKDYDKSLVFYENGGEKIKNSLKTYDKNISIFIGPEGGFETEEIDKLKSFGATISTLGTRILRTETASLAAISVITNLFD